MAQTETTAPEHVESTAPVLFWRYIELGKSTPEQILLTWIEETTGRPDVCLKMCKDMLGEMGSLHGDQLFRQLISMKVYRRLYSSRFDLSVFCIRTGKRYSTFVAPFGMGDMSWVRIPVRTMSPVAKMALGLLIKGQHFAHGQLIPLHHQRIFSCFRMNDAMCEYMESKGIGVLWMKMLLIVIVQEAMKAEIPSEQILCYLTSLEAIAPDLPGFYGVVHEVIDDYRSALLSE